MRALVRRRMERRVVSAVTMATKRAARCVFSVSQVVKKQIFPIKIISRLIFFFPPAH